MFVQWFICLFALIPFSLTTNKIVCYYQGASVVQINPNLCTHLNYAFVGINSSGHVISPKTNLFKQLIDLKLTNSSLKVLLSIGGGGVSGKTWSSATNTTQSRTNFVESCRKLLLEFDFDGLDLDWETPSNSDKDNFVKLSLELRTILGSKRLLTAALPSIPRQSFDVVTLVEVFDFLNVMSYDFYGPWSAYTGHNSALFASKLESPYEQKYLNLKKTAENWLKTGIPKEKLIMGLTFYGRLYRVKDANHHGIHGKFYGGKTTRNGISYKNICSKLTNWTEVFDEEQKNPIKFHEDQWLTYDNAKSLTLKVQFIKEQNYGGAMIWQIGQDDLAAICPSSKKQFLLQTINDVMWN